MVTKYDRSLIGQIAVIGENQDIFIEFDENGKYYAREGLNYVYIGIWQNREKVFSFLKSYDKYLNLCCKNIFEVEMCVCLHFGRKPRLVK